MPAAATLQNLAAYALQIAAVTALAALLLRIVPVASAGFRYAYWRVVLAAALIAPWILRAAPRAAEPTAAESAGGAVRVFRFVETSSAVPAAIDGGMMWLS